MSFPAKTITSNKNKKMFCLSANFLRFNFSIFYKDTADQVGGEIIWKIKKYSKHYLNKDLIDDTKNMRLIQQQNTTIYFQKKFL